MVINRGGDGLKYLMQCGHVANGVVYKTGKPICALCAGFGPEAEIVERECSERDGLEERKAVCCYGGHEIVDSSWELPFFKYQPEKEYDEYYCGCMGWD